MNPHRESFTYLLYFTLLKHRESSVAELPHNRSVVLTARALHGRARDFPHARRLFARSDNGGETWAHTWVLHYDFIMTSL